MIVTHGRRIQTVQRHPITNSDQIGTIECFLRPLRVAQRAIDLIWWLAVANVEIPVDRDEILKAIQQYLHADTIIYTPMRIHPNHFQLHTVA